MFQRSPVPPALLFDLDGTLIDSVPDLRVALNRCLEEDGRPSVDDAAVSRMIGNGVRMLVRRGYDATGGAPDDENELTPLVERFLEYYGTEPVALTKCYDGVVSTLERLAETGHAMAICTNKPIGPTLDILELLNLSRFFPMVIGGGSTPHLKPHPEPVFAALQGLDAQASNAVFIGDSLNDSDAARAAGLPSICVTFGYRRCSLEELGADILIDRFDALPDALARLPARNPEPQETD